MMTAPTTYVPVTLIGIGIILLWCWCLWAFRPGKVKDLIRGFGFGMFIALGIISCAGRLGAEDRPIGYITDRVLTKGSPVYEFIDPLTGRRFLVFSISNGNGGYNPAVVEATPTPSVIYVRPEPVPVPVVPPAPAAPPVPNSIPWDYAESYSFGPKQQEKGWCLMNTTVVLGRPLFHLRRPNPGYVPSSVEVEKP